MQHIKTMNGRFGAGSIAAERGVDRRVDPLVKGLGAGLFGLPDVDVTQAPIGLPDTQVQDLADQRDYVTRMKVAGSAREMLTIYAHAITGIQQRLAPVFIALRDAAVTDPECAALWTEIGHRRAMNMRRLAADLRATGELRGDLSDEQVADIIWSMNAAEYWVLLVRGRSWTAEQFAAWLTDAWTRLLLAGEVDP